MAGRMGNVRTTVQSLKVHAVDVEKGLILIKGAIPGANGSLVLVRTAAKKGADQVTSIDVLDASGAKTGTVDLPEDIFGAKVNVPLIHQVVVAQLAARRQGTHKAKTRGEVRGGGKKPYRQKGTGRARQGSTRAPQFAGGGVVHGPVPRDYSQRTPKKMKAAALRGALSDRARGGRVHVVSGLVIDGETPKTKAALQALRADHPAKSVLIVVADTDELTWLSLRNLPRSTSWTPGSSTLTTCSALTTWSSPRRRTTRSWLGWARAEGRRLMAAAPISHDRRGPRACGHDWRGSSDPRDILIKPVVSEKSYGLIDEQQVHVPGRTRPPTRPRSRSRSRRSSGSRSPASTRSTGRASASAPGPVSASVPTPSARS